MNKLEKLLETRISQPEGEKLIGVNLVEAKDGSSVCRWELSDDLKNGNGVTLGGFITTAADIGMAYALLSVIEDHITFTSISINTTFHRPAIIGDSDVIIKSFIKRQGRSTAYLESELYQNEKLIADVTSTVFFLQEK